MELFRRYFTEDWTKIIWNATANHLRNYLVFIFIDDIYNSVGIFQQVKFFWHIFSVYKTNRFLFLFLLTELLTKMKLPTNGIPTDRFRP